MQPNSLAMSKIISHYRKNLGLHWGYRAPLHSISLFMCLDSKHIALTKKHHLLGIDKNCT